MALHLDHVQLAAPPGCEAAARAFYVDLLGLTERPKQGETANTGGAWFDAGNVEVHIGTEADFRPAKKAHIALRAVSLPELESLARRLGAAGHVVRWDTRLPGTRRFFTDDPWGNRIELVAAGG